MQWLHCEGRGISGPRDEIRQHLASMEKNRTSGHEEGYPKAPWKILRACPDIWKQSWQMPDTTQNTDASYDINVHTIWSLNELLPQVYELI